MPSVKQYGFGIVAAEGTGAAARRTQLAELCRLLSDVADVTLVPHLSPTYGHLASSVERGVAAFAWLSPLLALDLTGRRAARPLLLPFRRRPTATFYHSAIIVAPGGPKTVADLVGARAAWVDRQSIAGYVAAKVHLAQAGFSLTKLGRESFVESHRAVVEAVTGGKADVGATFCSLDPGTQRILTAAWTSPEGAVEHKVEVLATVGPIPNDAIVVASTTPDAVAEKVAAALSTLEAKRARDLVGELLYAEGFTRALGSHFAPLEALVTRAKDLRIF